MKRFCALFLATMLMQVLPPAMSADHGIVLAQGAHNPTGAPPADATTPEERMRRRYPQPVRVGDLIGLRVLDDGDVTIGFVRQVVRTTEGKVKLIVSTGGFFGWGARPVAVPIEVVAILGRQIASLDMPPSEYKSAATWIGTDAAPLGADESIRIAITRR
jgi:PRC-barrel domain